MTTPESMIPDREHSPANASEAKATVILAGALVGAAVGAALAYAWAREARASRLHLSPSKAIKLSMVLLGTARQMAALLEE